MKKLTKSIFKELKKQKSKDKFLLFLDTPILVEEAIKNGYSPNFVLLSENSSFEFLNKYNDVCYLASTEELSFFSDAKTNAGLVAAFNVKNKPFKKINSKFLVLDGLQDAGNVGTLLRTALACDFNSVILVDCVHLSNPKLIRSSAGAIFKLNILECNFEDFLKLKLKNLIYADMNGKDIKDTSFYENFGLVLGNEGNGVSKKMRNLCEASVALKMKNDLESLNVAVAGSIIMYFCTHFKN